MQFSVRPSLSTAVLVQVSILGTDPTQSENTFSSSLTVKPGDTINYEVELEMAPLGTVNATRTVTFPRFRS